MDLTRVHNFDTVESGHTQRDFRKLCYPNLYKMASRVNPGSRRKEKEAEAHAAKQQAESTQEADARRKRVAKAQAAKWQAESTGQEAGARRKKEAEAQVAKRQPRKQTQ